MIVQLIAAVVLSQSGQSALTALDGLHVATFEQTQGQIHIYLPSDMAAGDTISGVVIAAPKGDTQSERSMNATALDGETVTIGDLDVPVKGGRFTVDIPEEAEDIEIEKDGAPSLKIATAPFEAQMFFPVFAAPGVVQGGRPLVLSGPFDGDASSTGVTFDGQTAPVLAESPRQSVVATPAGPSSSSEVKVTEVEAEIELAIRLIQIGLTTPQTVLQRGQKSEVKLEVMGLEGLEQPIYIEVTNKSPDIIKLDDGDRQELKIDSSNVHGGICGFALGLMAKQTGGFALGAEIMPVAQATAPPIGFKWDPDHPGVAIPDDTGLKDGDKIGPRGFHPDSLDNPSAPGRGKWQDRDAPTKEVLDDVTVWLQHISVASYKKNGRDYRGGEFVVHFKYTGTDCIPGKWRQIYRSTTYVGRSVDTLKPAHLVDGRMVPHSDADHKGDWTIDTNAAGRAVKNADYPHQDKGEMYDSPDRGFTTLGGHYTNDEAPRTKAMVVRKEVEFYAFWIGPNGEICKTIKWGMVTTFEIKEGDNPSTAAAMNRAKVSSTFTDPVVVDPESDEGKAAASAYAGALSNFMN